MRQPRAKVNTVILAVLGAVSAIIACCCCVGILASESESELEPGFTPPARVTASLGITPSTQVTASPEPVDIPEPEVEESEEVGESVYYANCDEARKALAAPLYRGEPGYRKGLDRDGDGVACQKR